MTDQNNSKHYEILTQLRSKVYQQRVKNSDQNSISFPVKLIEQNSETGKTETEPNLHKLAKTSTKLVQTT